jgi:hypothetical protein
MTKATPSRRSFTLLMPARSEAHSSVYSLSLIFLGVCGLERYRLRRRQGRRDVVVLIGAVGLIAHKRR